MWTPEPTRYDSMQYRRCGNSGLKLPLISLGLWQNFGSGSDFANAEEMCRTAFDLGITHFDLANNYGYPYNGSAEENFGKILHNGLRPYRDELCISTKAGYAMWDGPYGNQNGSRKYLIASLDQSLKRMGLDYVDIFYHHVVDKDTPMEETALALDQVVRQGKALYVGISNYNCEQTSQMQQLLRELKTPFIVNQPSYSMLNRWIEADGLDAYCRCSGLGMAVFSPLHQGLLTNRYLDGIPADSRIGKGGSYIENQLTDTMLTRLRALNVIAGRRGQTLSQMAIAWILHNPAITTVLVGASRPAQIKTNVGALQNLCFTEAELAEIEQLLQ